MLGAPCLRASVPALALHLTRRHHSPCAPLRAPMLLALRLRLTEDHGVVDTDFGLAVQLAVTQADLDHGSDHSDDPPRSAGLTAERFISGFVGSTHESVVSNPTTLSSAALQACWLMLPYPHACNDPLCVSDSNHHEHLQGRWGAAEEAQLVWVRSVAQQATKALGVLMANKEAKVKANKIDTEGSARLRLELEKKKAKPRAEPLFAAGWGEREAEARRLVSREASSSSSSSKQRQRRRAEQQQQFDPATQLELAAHLEELRLLR